MLLPILQAILTTLGALGVDRDIIHQLKYLKLSNQSGDGIHRDKQLLDRVKFFQEVLIAANEIGFCIYPALLPQMYPFNEEYLNTIGIDERYHSNVETHRLQTGFKHMIAPTEDKIPYKAHMVWLTHPDSPKEMMSQTDRESLGYEFHLNVTIKTLSKYNFTMTLWVNSIELIPVTKKWADSRGIIVRELKEFEGVEELNPALEEINLSIQRKRFAEGADIARLLVIYAYGGIYADQDHEIIEYDPMLNKMNLFLYSWNNIGYRTVENSLFGASPKNVFMYKYLAAIIRNRKGEAIPHCESICMKQSYYYILFQTGPFQMSRVFNQLLLSGDLNDQLYLVLDSKIAYDGKELQKSQEGDKYLDLVFNDKTHRLNVRFKHFLSGSWADWRSEVYLFGWQK